ncbi:MAG: acylphosphatase [Anaerolineaceae bacterium]|nr:acylphosphatase [Anaerolineaceae bacterium]
MPQHKQLTAIVHGYVQGVSFRYYTRRAANRLGISGWVANLRNGNVKVVAEGEEADLQQFLAFLHEGSPAARVDRVEAAWAEAENAFQNFSVRFIDV